MKFWVCNKVGFSACGDPVVPVYLLTVKSFLHFPAFDLCQQSNVCVGIYFGTLYWYFGALSMLVSMPFCHGLCDFVGLGRAGALILLCYQSCLDY